jgi:flagellar motor switch protein FliM
MSAPVHDFTRPAPLTADWQQRLGGWFRAALALAAKVSAKEMAFPPEGKFRAADVVRPGEALRELPEGTTGYAIALGGDRLRTLLVLARPALLALVGGLLGEAAAELPADRELTAVDDSLADYLLQRLLLPAFRQIWPGAEALAWGVPAKEPYPQASRMFVGDEPAVRFAFALAGPFGDAEFTWLMPRKALLAAAGGTDDAPAAPPPVRVDAIVDALPVELVVQLGTVELRLSELAGLLAGDVVVLNQRVTDPLAAVLGDKKKLFGWAGRTGSWQVFQLASRADG